MAWDSACFALDVPAPPGLDAPEADVQVPTVTTDTKKIAITRLMSAPPFGSARSHLRRMHACTQSQIASTGEDTMPIQACLFSFAFVISMSRRRSRSVTALGVYVSITSSSDLISSHKRNVAQKWRPPPAKPLDRQFDDNRWSAHRL
jgi:hypothetical protein